MWFVIGFVAGATTFAIGLYLWIISETIGFDG